MLDRLGQQWNTCFESKITPKVRRKERVFLAMRRIYRTDSTDNSYYLFIVHIEMGLNFLQNDDC